MTDVLPNPTRRVLAWDLPTRLFKWTLVLLVADAWISNKAAGSYPAWHKWNGYAILVLIVFRVLWGFFGGSTARFSHFVKPWKALPYAVSMFRIPGTKFLGHNPLGGLMVLVMLAVVFAQGATGLFSADSDRLVIEGPLAKTVADTTVEQITRWHHFGFNVILALVSLHVLAVLFYDVIKGHRLILAMIAGTKSQALFADEAEATPGSWTAALLCLAAAVVIVFGAIAALGGSVLR